MPKLKCLQFIVIMVMLVCQNCCTCGFTVGPPCCGHPWEQNICHD